jgi:hypothetical protein
MINSIEINEVEDIVKRFPGPITLVPSRVKWWIVTILGAGMTSGSIFAGLYALSQFRVGVEGAGIGLGIGILGTAFFGLGVVVGMINLLPAGSSLRLDENGFEVIGPLRKQIFRWGEVSDFDVFNGRATSVVVFNAAKPRLTILEKFGAALTGGRNGTLPDTYGSASRDLAQLMD